MTSLYLINRAVSTLIIDELVDTLSEQDAVLLIEDAVYAAAQFKQSPFPVTTGVLVSDCRVRGLAIDNCPFEQIQDYEEMITWVLKYEKTITWSR